MTDNLDLSVRKRMETVLLKEDQADIYFNVGLDEASKVRY